MTRPLTVEQVAERWQVHPRTVRTLIADGHLRHWRLGGKLIRISLEAVEEYEAWRESTSLESSRDGTSSSGGKAGGDTASDFLRLIAE
jgi:excisionase family DNA binding protein